MYKIVSFSLAALVFVGANAQAQTLAPQMPKLLASSAVESLSLETRAAPLWSISNIEALALEISKLDTHGLTPADYHFDALKKAVKNPDSQGKVSLDTLASDAWMAAAAHMIYGKLNPLTVEPDWTAARRQADIPGELKTMLAENSVSGSLSRLAPKQPGYGQLQAELARLRALDEETTLPISEGDALKKGMSGARVKALQSRLIQLGHLTMDVAHGQFDTATFEALKTYQLSQYLDDDGVAGAGTIRSLNTNRQSRIDSLLVNLERFRWLPDDLGRRHVHVNIAEFKVTAWKDGIIERTHLGVVGKPFRQTPVFSDEIEYIIFNPWWETPRSLTIKDKLPMFKKDPTAVQRLGFEILDRNNARVDPATIDWNSASASNFPYRIRQAPGDVNALGQVKIIFPNPHNVYLHDTPTRGLFSKQQRAFSSGCIRTQNPIDLSEWLLSETPDWNRTRINTSLTSKAEIRATLAQKVPVHVLYNTVVYDAELGLRYLDDIYSRDGRVLTALSAPAVNK